jgi:hypothetical protein
MKIRRKFVIATLLSSLLVFASYAAWAEEPAPGGQPLEQAASDPTASLMSLQIQNLYVGDYHKLADENSNTIQLRSAVPFKLGGLDNIARVTLPYLTHGPNGSGLGDITVFDLVAFDQSWGRWGIGPVLLLPTGKDGISAEKWAIGPALGFTARQPGLLWGLFNQNLFSFAGDGQQDVRVSIIQPIFNYSLPDKWSIGTSEMNFTYDWEKKAWTALPLGVKVAKLTKFGSLPVQFIGSYEYNFADDYVGSKWTLSFTLKFLFPL